MLNNVIDECGHTFISVQAIFCKTPRKSKKENKVRSTDEKRDGYGVVLYG